MNESRDLSWVVVNMATALSDSMECRAAERTTAEEKVKAAEDAFVICRAHLDAGSKTTATHWARILELERQLREPRPRPSDLAALGEAQLQIRDAETDLAQSLGLEPTVPLKDLVQTVRRLRGLRTELAEVLRSPVSDLGMLPSIESLLHKAIVRLKPIPRSKRRTKRKRA